MVYVVLPFPGSDQAYRASSATPILKIEKPQDIRRSMPSRSTTDARLPIPVVRRLSTRMCKSPAPRLCLTLFQVFSIVFLLVRRGPLWILSLPFAARFTGHLWVSRAPSLHLFAAFLLMISVVLPIPCLNLLAVFGVAFLARSTDLFRIVRSPFPRPLRVVFPMGSAVPSIALLLAHQPQFSIGSENRQYCQS